MKQKHIGDLNGIYLPSDEAKNCPGELASAE